MSDRINMATYVKENKTEDTVADKLLREAQLVGTGLLGIKEGAQASIDDPLGTAGRFALAFGIGALTSRSGAGALKTVMKTGGTAMGLSMCTDIGLKAHEVTGAVVNNWESSANWQANAAIMKRDLGRFTFDTLLMTGAGMAGGKVGASLRPSHNPFHEDFLNSRADGRLAKTAEGATIIEWDRDYRGWHKPIYSRGQIADISKSTGLSVPEVRDIASMPSHLLVDNLRYIGPQPEFGTLNYGRANVLQMTDTLRGVGTLGTYFGETPGLSRTYRSLLGTRRIVTPGE